MPQASPVPAAAPIAISSTASAAVTLRPCLVRAVAYALLLTFVLYFGLHCFRYRWVGDINRHVAVVASFYLSLSHPQHEALAIDGSETHTPYMLAVAVMGRTIGVSPFRALQIVGVCNLVLFVAGLMAFCRAFSLVPSSALPPVLLLFVILFVRNRNYFWASETSYATLRLIQAYPSLFGWSLALLLFALADRYLMAGTVGRLLMLVAGSFTLLLSHFLTGGWLVVVLVTLALTRMAEAPGSGANAPRVVIRRGVLLLLALAVAALSTLAWPYFSPLRLGSLPGAREGSLFGEHPFRDLSGVYLLAAAASPLLLRRGRHRFILAGFLGTYLTLLLFQARGFDYGNRYAFFMAFFAQFAVAEAAGITLARTLERNPEASALLSDRWSRWLGTGVTVGLVLVSVTAPIFRDPEVEPLRSPAALLNNPPMERVYYDRTRPLAPFLQPTDVVLLPVSKLSFDIPAATGARVVASLFSYSVPDYDRRMSDVDQFFAEGASRAARQVILARYGVTRVLVPKWSAASPSEFGALLGPSLFANEEYALFSVPPP